MKLTVVMLDTQRSYLALVHENQSIPYRKRLVEIELSPEQVDKLTPRKTGSNGTKNTYEERGEIYLEEIYPPKEPS